MRYFLGSISLILVFCTGTLRADPQVDFPQRKKVIATALDLLRNWPVSYVFGGNRLGSPQECERCNQCLASAKPAPKQRLQDCPACQHCSLDCSHFISLVFNRTGLRAPYLTTTMMRDLAPDVIQSRFGWRYIGREARRVQPGDIIVYAGHVVMVTSVSARSSGVGDVIHATSGREVKGAGHGIQLQSNVKFEGFRGTIQRIFRHNRLDAELQTYLRAHRVRKMEPVSQADGG